MDWTWSEALRIGGIGFGLVFVVLIILAVAILVVGLVTRRIGRGKSTTGKGE